MYEYVSDDINRGGYISKEIVLKYVSQYDIYQFAVGYRPQLDKMYVSPFREDENPGCYYQEFNNKLYLVDFAAIGKKIKNIKLDHVLCFDAVMIKFNLSDIKQTLYFIYAKLCLKKPKLQNTYKFKSIEKPKLVITPFRREFTEIDKKYWQQYYISKDNLISDKVLPLIGYQVSGEKNYFTQLQELAYCYADFSSGHKKIYFPQRSKDEKYARFITNCTANDVGGLSSLPPIGDKLVITKSYKDWRVLRNVGLDCVWFQTEGCVPDSLLQLCKRFDEVVILFDNDDAGIVASKKIAEIIDSSEILDNKVKEVRAPKIPKVTDPSDYIKYNIIEFKKFKENFI